MESKNETSKIDWDNDPDAISKFINSSGYYPHVLSFVYGETKMGKQLIEEEIKKHKDSASAYYNDIIKDKYTFKPIPGLEHNIDCEFDYFVKKDKET